MSWPKNDAMQRKEWHKGSFGGVRPPLFLLPPPSQKCFWSSERQTLLHPKCCGIQERGWTCAQIADVHRGYKLGQSSHLHWVFLTREKFPSSKKSKNNVSFKILGFFSSEWFSALWCFMAVILEKRLWRKYRENHAAVETCVQNIPLSVQTVETAAGKQSELRLGLRQCDSQLKADCHTVRSQLLNFGAPVGGHSLFYFNTWRMYRSKRKRRRCTELCSLSLQPNGFSNPTQHYFVRSETKFLTSSWTKRIGTSSFLFPGTDAPTFTARLEIRE